jgi:hypothetical protein
MLVMVIVMHKMAITIHRHVTGTVEIAVRAHVLAQQVGLAEKQDTVAQIQMYLITSFVVVTAPSLVTASVTSSSSIWMKI